MFTVGAAWWAYQEGEHALQVRAEDVAGDTAQGIREIVERDVSVATILATEIEDPAAISAQEWSARVSRAWRAGAFQQVSAVNLSLRATSVERLRDLVAARPGGQDRPFSLRVADEPPHVVIFQVWPEADNVDALGFDIAGNVVAHQVLERSLRANQPFATPPIELVQEREGQRATVVYVPIVTPQDGRVRGAVTLAFRADEVLAQVRPRGTADVDVRWDDTTVAGDGRLSGSQRPLVRARASADVVGFGPGWRITTDVSRASLSRTTRLAPWGIAASGAAVTVAVLLVLSSGRRLQRRAEQLADQRGQALRAQATELELANRELRHLDTVKDRVLRSVTHDLRAPLTVIVGMTDLLRHHDLDGDRQAHLLARVEHQAARLERMVDELATASQLDAGRIEPELAELRLDQLVTRVAHELVGQDARVTAPAAMVCADAAHVERIVVNLVTNALRHGAPPVEVSVHPGADRVEVHVRDHGRGVAGDARQRIFQEFTSLEVEDRSEGLGLGLAISRRLAELNGGQLTCEDPGPDGGALFVLRLPAVGRATPGPASTQQDVPEPAHER